MRLKRRLALTFTGVTAGVLLVSFTSVYAAVLRSETAELDAALTAQALTAAGVAQQRAGASAPLGDGLIEMPEVPAATTRYAATYDGAGNLIAATRSFGTGAPPSLGALLGPTWRPPEGGEALDLPSMRGPLRAVLVPRGPEGALLFAVSRHSIDSDMAFLWRVFSALFVGAVLTTALVARWLGARLGRDVEALALAARAVAGGDLTARVAERARGSDETRNLGRDLDHMVSQLSALVEAQRTFVSYAAHELRSPLAALRGELQLALRRPRDNEAYRAFISESLAEVDQLVSLAEGLLTLARVQRADGVSDATLASDFVGDALRLARAGAAARGMSLVEPPFPNAPLAVAGRRADLARALRNLVENAVVHGPPGSTVWLELAVTDDATVTIAVEDEGEGVPSEDVPHIFAPFYRGSRDQDGERTGAGLGLAIAREIARAAGGDVTLESRAGEGARFVLRLRKTMPPERPSIRTDTSAALS